MSVSVIALCYNHAPYLVECLESIRNQTYRDIQLIIVDDCSKDASVETIRRWIEEHKSDCRFIAHQENKGVCKSINEALTYATGEFVSIVATDDVWLENKIAEQIKLFARPEVGVVYSDAYRIDSSGKLLEPKTFLSHHPEGKIFSYLVHGNFIPAPSALIRSSCLTAVGPYDERLCYEDYDMWLRLSQRFEFAYSPEVLVKYRVLGTSLSHRMAADRRRDLNESNLIIFSKLLNTPMSQKDWANVKRHLSDIIYYHHEQDPKVSRLWDAMRRMPRLKTALFLCLTLAGVPVRGQFKLLDGVRGLLKS